MPPSGKPERAGPIIGLEQFTKISEAEGRPLSEEAKRMFAEFDGLGLTDEERRRVIIERFRPQGEEQSA
jgi:hypothetical protein